MKSPLVACVALSVIGCGDDRAGVTVRSIARDSECHAYLDLQCSCCGSGQDACGQYVALLIEDGQAYTNSTEDECRARREQVTDVPRWCAETFTSEAALRAACQGFGPGSVTSDVTGDSSED